MKVPDVYPPCSQCLSKNPDARVPVDNQSFCPRCLSDLSRCDRCSRPTLKLNPTVDCGQLCDRCVSGWKRCVSCRGLTGSLLQTEAGAYVCRRCSLTFFDLCFECGRYCEVSRYVSGGHRACSRCATTLSTCPDCQVLMFPARACDSCARRDSVWNYTYKPDPLFHGEGPLFLGLELEVVVPEFRFQECVLAATGQLGRLGYLKRDSSIRPCGFELVTHPMSYGFALEGFPWPLLGSLADLGCVADESVGLHVHVSRAGFDSPAHVYRWMKLLYRNEPEVVSLARRRSHYAPFDDRARAKARDTAKGPVHALGLDRYQAINPHPRHTLELRVFASSLEPGEVQAALAFAAASVEYTRGLRIPEVRAGGWGWGRFAEWVAARPEYLPLITQMEDLACAC